MKIEEAYALMGLSAGCTADELKKAFRNKSKIVHPDTGGSKELFEKLVQAKELIETHKVNSRTYNKDMYDSLMKDAKDAIRKHRDELDKLINAMNAKRELRYRVMKVRAISALSLLVFFVFLPVFGDVKLIVFSYVFVPIWLTVFIFPKALMSMFDKNKKYAK